MILEKKKGLKLVIQTSPLRFKNIISKLKPNQQKEGNNNHIRRNG